MESRIISYNDDDEIIDSFVVNRLYDVRPPGTPDWWRDLYSHKAKPSDRYKYFNPPPEEIQRLCAECQQLSLTELADLQRELEAADNKAPYENIQYIAYALVQEIRNDIDCYDHLGIWSNGFETFPDD